MTSGLVLHVIVLDYFTSMRSVLNLLGGGCWCEACTVSSVVVG